MPIAASQESWHDALLFPFSELSSVIEHLSPSRLLLLGDCPSPSPCPVPEVRRLALGPTPLRACLAFRDTSSGWTILALETDDYEFIRWLTLASAEDGDVAGRGWFDALWPSAKDAGPQPVFPIGATVTRLGDDLRWTVAAHLRRSQSDRWIVRIVRHDQQVDIDESGLALVDDASEGPLGWIAGDPCSASQFALTIAYVKLANPLTDTVYSYLSTKTVLRSYQFRPLLKLLASPHQRLLIADEVGLGKTIEAGLIWTELDQRVGVNRALVVCPSSLVHKWRDELRRRFDREVRILDRHGIKDMVELAETDDPRPFQAITSLEGLRSSRELETLSSLAPRFDLIIVDEAHYLRNQDTRSHALGELLSDWADVLLFLSATPLNLGQQDLFNLLNLLEEEEFSDRAVFVEQMHPNLYFNAIAKSLPRFLRQPRELLAMLDAAAQTPFGAIAARRPEFATLQTILDTDGPLSPRDVSEARGHLAELNTLSTIVSRTRKADTKERKVTREAWPIDVAWTAQEAQLYRAVHAWARQRALQASGVVGFATQMPLRQAASCLPALRERLMEQHPQFRASDDDFDDTDDVEPLLDDDLLDATSLARALHRAMIDLGDTDTKFDQFWQELTKLRDAGVAQVMVFSFFRGTLSYLGRRLTQLGFSVRVMDGSVKMDERITTMRDFRDGRFTILLLSEVGSEGLDFEFCQAIVNYDLPWNPMRVEQRIGRLDRFGSPHEKIFIVNFHVPGTIETDIFERLYLRIGVFEASIGELEPILRDQFRDLTRVALDPSLSDSQREAEIMRIAVAVETQRRDLDDIAEAEEYLSGIDSLMIDGFERATDREGRFVGRSEIKLVLDDLFSGTGARLATTRGVLELQGSADLRDRVIATGVTGGASRFAFPRLLARLSDEDPIPVTFDNEEAAKTGLELMSLRHPLVISAVRRITASGAALGRFASLQISGDLPGEFLVGLWLVNATGLRPSLELWPIAVDLSTGEINDDAGLELLRACARGALREGSPTRTVGELTQAYHRAQEALDRRIHQEQAEKQAANELLIDSRLRARKDGIRLKIATAERTMRKVSDRGIRRLYEGRIRNLKLRSKQIEAELSQRRGLVMTSQAVAVASVLIDR